MKDKRADRYGNIIELIIVLLLGLTSIASSFAAYQASLNEGEASAAYNDGVATITDANSMYISAGQKISNDMSLYQSLLVMGEELDGASGSSEKERMQTIIDNFSAKFLSQELLDAIK